MFQAPEPCFRSHKVPEERSVQPLGFIKGKAPTVEADQLPRSDPRSPFCFAPQALGRATVDHLISSCRKPASLSLPVRSISPTAF